MSKRAGGAGRPLVEYRGLDGVCKSIFYFALRLLLLAEMIYDCTQKHLQ